MNDLEQRVKSLETLVNNLIHSDKYTFQRHIQILDGNNIFAGANKGLRIGTATNQKLGFFNQTPVVQQASGENLTNSVTVGGTTGTIPDFTNLSTYSTDAAAIRNGIYQLARKLKQVNDALRLFGLLN